MANNCKVSSLVSAQSNKVYFHFLDEISETFEKHRKVLKIEGPREKEFLINSTRVSNGRSLKYGNVESYWINI